MVHCGNEVAVKIVNNPVQQDRLKYMEVDHYFIKNHLDKEQLDFRM